MWSSLKSVHGGWESSDEEKNTVNQVRNSNLFLHENLFQLKVPSDFVSLIQLEQELALCSINLGDTQTPLRLPEIWVKAGWRKKGPASKKGSTWTSTNNVIQICCVMLPRRSHCGSGSIYEVWFLLERCWPILGAYCDPHTHITTQREWHLRWHDAEKHLLWRNSWHI